MADQRPVDAETGREVSQPGARETFNKDIVDELVSLGVGTRKRCIRASTAARNFNDINEIMDRIDQLSEHNSDREEEEPPTGAEPGVLVPGAPLSAGMQRALRELRERIELLAEQQEQQARGAGEEEEVMQLKQQLQQKEYMLAVKDGEIAKISNDMKTSVAKQKKTQEKFQAKINTLLDSFKQSQIDAAENVEEQMGQLDEEATERAAETQSIIAELRKAMEDNNAQFEANIVDNQKKINALEITAKEIKIDVAVQRELVAGKMTALSAKVQKLDDFAEERQNSLAAIEAEVDGLLRATKESVDFQQRVMALCSDNKENETFYKCIAQRASMMFFDAKVVISDFVAHEIAGMGGAAAGIDKAANVVGKLAGDIPFVGAVVGLVRAGMSAGYNIFVLKGLAKNVMDFELKLGGDVFAKHFALEMTLLYQKQLKKMYEKHSQSSEKKWEKKLRKEVEETAGQLGDDLVKVVGSGHAAKILAMCSVKTAKSVEKEKVGDDEEKVQKAQTFEQVLCQLVKFQPILNRKDERADPTEEEKDPDDPDGEKKKKKKRFKNKLSIKKPWRTAKDKAKKKAEALMEDEEERANYAELMLAVKESEAAEGIVEYIEEFCTDALLEGLTALVS